MSPSGDALFARGRRLSASTSPTCTSRWPPHSARLAGTAAVACPAALGALAVVAGEGMARLFTDLGAAVLDGGPTFNPSTSELLAGVHEIAAEQVVVLPNSGNVSWPPNGRRSCRDKQSSSSRRGRCRLAWRPLRAGPRRPGRANAAG